MCPARTLAERFLQCLDNMPECESIDRDVAHVEAAPFGLLEYMGPSRP